ncbi:GlxA family transcriptional regulator [Pantoea sp. BS_4]|uniref:choline metabolism transcriptional regulator GbdR n=1 Tax=unclassified Pantoea TaxID=2630326 RepID=UPI002B473797|nr:GlxA family transcriptional regulator [Pantoea sp. JZ2]WRH12826.1 helix-turn-helix domain-containing protein [Pantoea sp. JZ2]
MFDTDAIHKRSSTENKTRSVGFLLVNNFTMIALATAVEPLRMANQLSGKELYSWYTVSEEGAPVVASDGIAITPDHSMANVPALDVMIVVGGVNITRSYSSRQIGWLQSLARRKILIGGICTGPYLLAEAGLLDGYHCSAHWECIASMQEAYPRVICTNQLFVIEQDRMTSSGGTVPMDMMLTMIQRHFGHQLTAAISEMFICDRVRNESDYQRIPLRHVLGTAQPSLVEAVSLMEANIEEAIDLDELAGYVGLSRRQLERLFQKYLHCSPSRYYLKLRLFRARQLLKQTSMSIIEIALACGFVSTPHFSKCYREHLGVPPREERRGVHSQGSGKTLTQFFMADLPGLTNWQQESTVSTSLRILNEARFEPTFGSVTLPGNL